MSSISAALVSLRPTATWALHNPSDYSSLEWLDTEQAQPTEAEIQAEITRLQAEYDARAYQRARAADYPSLAEQLDMLYWDGVNGTTNWANAIAAVKERNPKP